MATIAFFSSNNRESGIIINMYLLIKIKKKLGTLDVPRMARIQ